MKPLTYIGKQEFGRYSERLFNLQMPDGMVPTFGVAPGQDLKQRMMETQRKFWEKRKQAA